MLSSAAPTLSAPVTPVPYEILAIGGSAGAIQVLGEILARLPAAFHLPIVVVQHLPADWPSRLPEVLGYRSGRSCEWAEAGARPRPGTVHVAPAGRNLVLTADGRFGSVAGVKPRMGWPSVDLFFHSMAEVFGRQSIAVILSGMLYDGAEGIAAVRRAGGATMVQHPASALSRSMPDAAIDLGRVDLSRTPSQIAEAAAILLEWGVQ